MFKKLPVGKFLTNCYIIADEASKEAAVVDPADDFEAIRLFIEENDLKIKYIILTHAHGDHILALPQLKAYSKASVGLNIEDEEMLNKAELNMSGYFTQSPIEAKADFYLKDGEGIKLGEAEFKVIHTPGHTKGSICLLFDKDLITGDTLFANGFGRTDLYGGSYDSLVNSIQTKLFALAGDIAVHPGHGASSTIAREKENFAYL